MISTKHWEQEFADKMRNMLQSLSLLLLGMILGGSTVMALEPPPEPINLTPKERTAMIALYESLVESSSPMEEGVSETELLERLGQPDGVLTAGNRKRLAYGSGHAIVADGKVVKFDNMPRELLAAPGRQAYEDYQRAKGKVYYMGEWMSREESQEAYDKAMRSKHLSQQRIQHGAIEQQKRQQRAARASSPYLDYRQNGARVSERELIAPGKVTVIDFYADWCGPCRAITPQLQRMSQDPEVAVRKVDIVKWGSPVAQQWNLKSIPNMRVYDKTGKQVGKPTSDIRLVRKYVKYAKSKG